MSNRAVVPDQINTFFARRSQNGIRSRQTSVRRHLMDGLCGTNASGPCSGMEHLRNTDFTRRPRQVPKMISVGTMASAATSRPKIAPPANTLHGLLLNFHKPFLFPKSNMKSRISVLPHPVICIYVHKPWFCLRSSHGRAKLLAQAALSNQMLKEYGLCCGFQLRSCPGAIAGQSR